MENVKGKLHLEIKKTDSCEEIFSVISKIEEYPKFMPDVKEVKVGIFSEKQKSISDWTVDIDGCLLQWKSEDFFDPKNYKYEFKTVEGDFDLLIGKWGIDLKGEDCSKAEVNFEISYDLGIPTIQDVVGPVLKEKMKKNLHRMLSGIAKQLQQGSAVIDIV